MEELAMSGGQNGAPLAFVLLAEAQLAVGDAEAALATATGGLELAEALDQHFFDCELLRLQAGSVTGAWSAEEIGSLLKSAVDGRSPGVSSVWRYERRPISRNSSRIWPWGCSPLCSTGSWVALPLPIGGGLGIS